MTSEELQNYYENFPAALRKRLKSGALKFPQNVEFEYEPKEAYRCVTRKNGEENVPFNLNDVKSYHELGKKPKGVECDELTSFAVSFFDNIKMLERCFDFSNPKKAIAKGYVFCEGGPILVNKASHISWWLFEDVDLSGFEITRKSEVQNEQASMF